MALYEIEAKSILRKQKKIDSWFLSAYHMNLYRGCSHDCAYCDGRSEQYRVKHEFGKNVEVKTNAIEILARELDPSRKRVPMKRGYVLLGGGVSDAYQGVEKRYEITRQALQLLNTFHHPVHILTKSTLVLRDMDILKHIQKQANVIVSSSFSSLHEGVSEVFEPGVPSPQKRLEMLAQFKQAGFTVGLYLLPVIPFITDSPRMLEQVISTAKDVGVDFINFGGMTLKDGRQKDYFFKIIEEECPQLIPNYHQIYPGNKWGQPIDEYTDEIHARFFPLAQKYRMPIRIPFRHYHDVLDENDRVIVMLEHLHYLLQIRKAKSPYGWAAFNISLLEEPISNYRKKLRSINGIGSTTEAVIREVLDGEVPRLYKKLASEYG